jgi:hypothetical protein
LLVDACGLVFGDEIAEDGSPGSLLLSTRCSRVRASGSFGLGCGNPLRTRSWNGGSAAYAGEILDRTLIVNVAHLRKVLAEYETYFNRHRPHRVLHQASPLRALPDPIDADITVLRRDRLGGLLHEYSQVA